MERFIQCLDVLEDAIYAFAFLGERIRRLAVTLFVIGVTLLASGLGIALTLANASAGMTVAALLTIMVLYRSVTASPRFAAVNG